MSGNKKVQNVKSEAFIGKFEQKTDFVLGTKESIVVYFVKTFVTIVSSYIVTVL